MNILFVSHAANRSGAPKSLLCFVRWLAEQGEHRLWFHSLRAGPLEADFAASAVFAPLGSVRRASLLEAAWRRWPLLGPDRALLRILARANVAFSQSVVERWLQQHEIELIFLNSAASGAALDVLSVPARRAGVPIVAWIHEGAGGRAAFAGEWERVKKGADAFWAASEFVADQLRAEGVTKVETVFEMLDASTLAASESQREEARRALRARLNLKESAFLVGGCGTPEARKGFDWWPLVAAGVPNADFVWLGASEAALTASHSSNERLVFLPPTPTPASFFAALDVFCLPSREDPFPLVALEAAAWGVPIVCFDGAGGAPELVGAASGQPAGVSVPHGDVEAMSRAIEFLRIQPAERARQGANARHRAHAMSNVAVTGPRTVELLQELVTSTHRAA